MGEQMKQVTLSSEVVFEMHARPTRKAEFLQKMDRMVPWPELCALVKLFYPQAGNRPPPIRLERMLRKYWFANWFNLANEAFEVVIHDIPVFWEFSAFDMGRELKAYESTLLEEKDHGKAMFAQTGFFL